MDDTQLLDWLEQTVTNGDLEIYAPGNGTFIVSFRVANTGRSQVNGKSLREAISNCITQPPTQKPPTKKLPTKKKPQPPKKKR